MRFPRAQRLARATLLQRVQREGKPTRSKYLSIRSAASPHTSSRIGVIVPRHGRTAVDRNRLKRRLREIARVHILPDDRRQDMVIRAGQAAYDLDFGELRDEVLRLLARGAGT